MGIGKILLVWVKWVVIFWVTISGQLSFGVKWALFSGLLGRVVFVGLRCWLILGLISSQLFFRLSWRVGFFRVELLVDFWVVWAFVFLG